MRSILLTCLNAILWLDKVNLAHGRLNLEHMLLADDGSFKICGLRLLKDISHDENYLRQKTDLVTLGNNLRELGMYLLLKTYTVD